MEQKLRILVVEDSFEIRFIMKTELEWMGHRIELAENAEIGLTLAVANRPDVIVSDIEMPGMNGFEFLRRVRDLPELAQIPVIAVSGNAQPREIFSESGFSAHLTKPVEPQELNDVVQKLCSDSHPGNVLEVVCEHSHTA
jgi:CheY-like chemotaxis protein